MFTFSWIKLSSYEHPKEKEERKTEEEKESMGHMRHIVTLQKTEEKVTMLQTAKENYLLPQGAIDL